MNMGGEKYSKFLKPRISDFSARISLLYIVSHSIPLTGVLAYARPFASVH